MRVVVVAEYYPRPHDPVSGVWAHRQALAARDAGAEVRVLVLDRPLPPAAALRDPRRLPGELARAARGPRRVALDGIEVEYVRYLSPPRARSYAHWHRYARGPLARALDRAGPADLVHAHYAHLAGAAAYPWTARRGLPLAVSVHGGDVLAPTLASPPARATVANVLRRADAVLCNSRATLRTSAALAGGGDRMRVVHLGTDVPADLPPKHQQPTVATVANVDPRKRHEDVLRALPEGTRWVVIGDGPEVARLRRLADERVAFLGRLPHERAMDELARCHVMALPSEDEAFGVAYVEAMARGVPAIGCAGEGGPEEIAALGDGMLLVPPRDQDALRAAIERALRDGELPAKARATAAAHFTWEACGRATVAAYEDAVRR
jgi:glycosyltransferase involved in cell wall biosynthesis